MDATKTRTLSGRGPTAEERMQLEERFKTIRMIFNNGAMPIEETLEALRFVAKGFVQAGIKISRQTKKDKLQSGLHSRPVEKPADVEKPWDEHEPEDPGDEDESGPFGFSV